MKKTIITILKVLVPLAIGVGLIWWLFKDFDFSYMFDLLKSDHFNGWWIVASLVISVFSHIFRALRWDIQLKAIGVKAPLIILVNSILGTYAVNLIFPRAGEVWRTGYIAKRQNSSFSTVFGSMVGDRLSDTFTVATLTLFTFFVAHDAITRFMDQYNMTESMMQKATSPTLWGGIIVCVVALLALFRSKTENKIILKVRNVVKNLWDGFAVLAKMDGKWKFLFYTICIWSCYYMQLYVATFAFDYTADLGVIAALVLFVLGSIGMVVPTNGGLGAWHIAIIFGLSLYGIGAPFDPNHINANAQTFAMTVWGAQTLLLIAAGIYVLIYILLDKKKVAQK